MAPPSRSVERAVEENTGVTVAVAGNPSSLWSEKRTPWAVAGSMPAAASWAAVTSTARVEPSAAKVSTDTHRPGSPTSTSTVMDVPPGSCIGLMAARSKASQNSGLVAEESSITRSWAVEVSVCAVTVVSSDVTTLWPGYTGAPGRMVLSIVTSRPGAMIRTSSESVAVVSWPRGSVTAASTVLVRVTSPSGPAAASVVSTPKVAETLSPAGMSPVRTRSKPVTTAPAGGAGGSWPSTRGRVASTCPSVP